MKFVLFGLTAVTVLAAGCGRSTIGAFPSESSGISENRHRYNAAATMTGLSASYVERFQADRSVAIVPHPAALEQAQLPKRKIENYIGCLRDKHAKFEFTRTLNENYFPDTKLQVQNRTVVNIEKIANEDAFMSTFRSNDGSESQKKTKFVLKGNTIEIQRTFLGQLPPSDPQRSYNCELQPEPANQRVAPKIAAGHFTMQNGVRVRATQSLSQHKTFAVCTRAGQSDKVAVPMNITRISVWTNEIPDLASPCIQHSILMQHEEAYTNSGDLVRLFHLETLSYEGVPN